MTTRILVDMDGVMVRISRDGDLPVRPSPV